MAGNKRLPVLKIENAEILGGKYRNFSGEERTYNNKGFRNFNLVVPEEIVDRLIDEGWNIKSLEPRDAGDPVKHYTQIVVNFDGARPPMIILHTSNGAVELTKETVGELDDAYIISCDVAVNPHYWCNTSGEGYKGYLKSMHVTIEDMDDFADKYRED